MGHGPGDLGTWSLEAIGTLGHGPGDLVHSHYIVKSMNYALCDLYNTMCYLL